MIVEQTLFGERNKLNEAIRYLKTFNKADPTRLFCLKFSGGKDSVVLYDIAVKTGINFYAQYDITTVDPPEVVHFIKKYYPKVHINYPKTNMWRLIAKKMMPPTRLVRYCCSVFKEKGCPLVNAFFILTGVRWKESVRRRKRSFIEKCQANKGKEFMHPIIEWDEEDVWEYINTNNLPYCKLYDEGWKRIGCIACPMARTEQRVMELERYPKFKDAYIRAFAKMLEVIKAKKGDECEVWKTPEDVMNWWLYPPKKAVKGQLDFYGEFFGDYYEQYEHPDGLVV